MELSREGLAGAGAEFEGKSNWESSEVNYDHPEDLKPKSLDRNEANREFNDQQLEQAKEKFEGIKTALSLKSPEAVAVLDDIYLKAETDGNLLEIMQDLDNQFFDSETLLYIDEDTEPRVLELLNDFLDAEDSKSRIEITKKIGDYI